MRLAIPLLLLLSFVADARADVVPPPECPHTLPANGSSCRAGGPAACTYPVAHGARRICSCRDGAWACEDLPQPHS